MTTIRVFLIAGLWLSGLLPLTAYESHDLPLKRWRRNLKRIKGLEGERLCAIAFPKTEAAALEYRGKEELPPGEYLLRLTLRPSHVCDVGAWAGGLRVTWGGSIHALAAIDFSRQNQPETKAMRFVHAGGIAQIKVAAYVDHKRFTDELAEREAKAMKGGAKVNLGALDAGGGDDLDDLGGDALDIVFTLDPAKNFYYLLDRAELTPLSQSAYVESVSVNKVRYRPGETLAGTATLAGRAGDGQLVLLLENGLNSRREVKRLPVRFEGGEQRLEFSISLPETELGYALVARYESADGKDASEKAEYFTVARNFYRVAIFGGPGGHGYSFSSREQMDRDFQAARKSYANAKELFAWAEEDMVEMSPEGDVWYSGQTCYRLEKQGLKQLIDVAHSHGWAMVSYAKFIMSGHLGWKTAWDYPNDHKQQYFFPVGMWNGSGVKILDRFRHKEFVPYPRRPRPREATAFDVFWSVFQPINPDPTPRMARIAAEEAIRAAEMFGWDGIRWDGHPRGRGQTGGAGKYSYLGARQTQLLVRYTKDIIQQRYPDFGFGYNYLVVQPKPSYDWAYEDFELDELAHGGGLLMNELIRSSHGKPYEWIARNLQVEGDLVRERGGYFLGIFTDQSSPRDRMIENILWFASGCRPYGTVPEQRLVNRYGTRYACYTLDETLRRLERPQEVLRPTAKTGLWWDPFVYETAATDDGRSQLVVNLLNLPRQAKPAMAKSPHASLEFDQGTVPAEFDITLPAGYRLEGAHFIDPFTLEVSTAPLEGGRLQAPSVNLWLVAILNLTRQAETVSLAERYGPPKTFGVPRPGLEVEREPFLPLDAEAPVETLVREFDQRFLRRTRFDEDKELAAMGWDERNRSIRKISESKGNQPEAWRKGWWKAGSLYPDLALKDKPPTFGDLTPRRNGAFDIYYARGALDHRLRVEEAVARLPRFGVHEATLGGRQHFGGIGYRLGNRVAPTAFPNYDLLVYVDIPHAAIGVRHSYALVDYVKAGGAALFTAGEYAFGKGGYTWTVLERELLPLVSVQMGDTRYTRDPLRLEAGPDFADLGVEADFAAGPLFWSWNQVALKEDAGVRVFLKAGNRPVLVGWELGQGRVACLLATHKGRSQEGTLAFFDWADWPGLVAGLIRWLAPAAGQIDPPPTPTPAKTIARLRESLADTGLDDLLDGEIDATLGDAGKKGEAGLGAMARGEANAACELDAETLAKRLALVEPLLEQASPEIGGLLAEQLATVANWPQTVKEGMIDAVHRAPPAGLAAVARRCLAQLDPEMQGVGYQLLAIAGDPAFAQLARQPPGKDAGYSVKLNRYLTVALPLYNKPDLLARGRELVAAWQAEELAVKHQYTGGEDWSMRFPEQPCLSSEALLKRAAWQAYLAQHAPAEHAAEFGRIWLMIEEYLDYCDRSIGNAAKLPPTASPSERAAAKSELEGLKRLRTFYARLGTLTQPLARRLFEAYPRETATGFAQASFDRQAIRCIRLLGEFPPEKVRVQLEILRQARQPRLARFAADRLRAARP